MTDDSGFISSPAPAATPPGTRLECGPFWPDLDVNEFRDACRIGGTLIPDPRVRAALLGAVLAADAELQDWRAAQEGAGFATLAAVPAPALGGESRLALLWRRAVQALASADLVETHRDVTAAGAAQTIGPEMDLRADVHRRNATHAIRDIRGATRTTVELI